MDKRKPKAKSKKKPTAFQWPDLPPGSSRDRVLPRPRTKHIREARCPNCGYEFDPHWEHK